jgi:hypothetical protein
VRVNGRVITPLGRIEESIFVNGGPEPGTHLVKWPRDGSRAILTTNALLRRIRFLEFTIVLACLANMIEELRKLRALKRRLKASARGR